jgi:hypothetical protein
MKQKDIMALKQRLRKAWLVYKKSAGMAAWLVFTSTKSFSKLGQWKVLKKT